MHREDWAIRGPRLLGEKDDEARFSPSSLELACIRYCRLAVYYQNKLLSTYPIHIDYYELDGASAVPLDDIYQIQNRYKVLTIFSRDAHWIFETSDQGAQFIPGIIKDMISFCGVARKADGSEDTLVLPGINCRLALPIPSGDALVRAIRDHKSKLASMHMPKTQYYRHVLEDDIMSLVG